MIWRRATRARAVEPARPEPDPWTVETLRLLDITRQGIALREAGELDRAQEVFSRLIAVHPGRPYGWQELGVLRLRQGRREEALPLFRRAIAAEPDDLLPRRHCALLLLDLGRPEEADAVLAAHPQRTEAGRAEAAAARQFLAFLRRWPQAEGVRLARELETGPAFLDAAAVEARVLSAVRERRAFSLVRVGDGEGAWLKLGPEDEALYPDLYAANRRQFLRLWFGDDGLYARPDFHAAAAGLADAMAGADVLGAPYPLRVAHEYGLRSSRGAPPITNLLRWLDAAPARRGGAVCSQDIHIQLQHAGAYRRMLGAAERLGVISCHPQLAAVLSARTGVWVDRVHLLPPEREFAHVLGASGVAAPHFPDVFDEVSADLRAHSHAGRVWVVAGGFLGKLYCEQIRRAGGVALDLGSVVDGWLGKVTRPTLVDIARFAL